VKTRATVLTDLGRKVNNLWQATVMGDPSGWPLRLPLGKPAKADLDTRWPTVRQWAVDWRTWAERTGLRVEWENRLVHGTTQSMPTHLTVPDIDIAAALLGGNWPDRIARGRVRHALLDEKFPHAATPATVRGVDPLTDTDFDLLCIAAAWFAVNDATGLTPRQVPIEGLHGKWLNTNRALLTLLAGRPTLGLVARPTRIHFTYLDPQHRADGGRYHDSLTLGDTMAPAYQPTVAVITENKDSAVYFPTVPGGITIEGNGNAATGLLHRVPWLLDVPQIVYWGDLDAAGYEIVNRLRSNGIPVETMLMDLGTYTAYERFGAWTDDKGNPLRCEARQYLPYLTAAEREVYEALTDPSCIRVRRIEQERIPLSVALEALFDLVRQGNDRPLQRLGSSSDSSRP
jgi:hypothetical protein